VTNLYRYSTNQYTKQYFPTTGVDFYLKRTSLPGAKNLALKLWDVSGQAIAGKYVAKLLFVKLFV
jgi:Ras-related protein Rab-28